jgi:hypothetical protein
VVRELSRCTLVDESLVQQPLDGPALGSNITPGVPRLDQFRLMFIELDLEASEHPLSSGIV